MKHVRDMVAAANSVVDHLPAAEAMGPHGAEGVTFVDLSDPRQLERRNAKRGIANLCIGGGEGTAVAIERE